MINEHDLKISKILVKMIRRGSFDSNRLTISGRTLSPPLCFCPLASANPINI